MQNSNKFLASGIKKEEEEEKSKRLLVLEFFKLITRQFQKIYLH